MTRFQPLLKRVKHLWNSQRPEEAVHALRTKKYLPLIRATMDEDTFFAIRNAWRAQGAPLRNLQYFAVKPWLKRALVRNLSLGLDRAKKGPLRILNIGPSFGYFAYTARFFGHDVTVLDSGGDPMLADLHAYFQLPRVVHAPVPQQKLPDFGGRFDLITAFGPSFNEIDRASRIYWGPEDWRYFLKDLLTNHLNPGGRIVIELDKAQKDLGGYSPEIGRVFRDMGASRRGNRVTIRRKGLDDDTF